MKKLFILIFMIFLTGCQYGVVEKMEKEMTFGAGTINKPQNNAYKLGMKNFTSELKDNISDSGSLKYIDESGYISFTPVEFGFANKTYPVENIYKAMDSDKWDGVFGEGTAIEIKEGINSWEKLVILNNPAIVDLIPARADDVFIIFEIDTDYVIEGWDKDSDMEIIDKVRIGDYSYLEQSSVWDSTTTETCVILEDEDESPSTREVCRTDQDKQRIRTVLSEDKGKLYFTKYIPVEWLKSAVFPIYTDAEVTFGSASEFYDPSAGDMVMDVKVTMLDTNKFVVTWWEWDMSTDPGYAEVGTVSGDTITWAGERLIGTGDMRDFTKQNMDTCALDTNKFVVAFIPDGDDDLDAIVGQTATSTDIVWGSVQSIRAEDWEYISVACVDTDKFVVCGNDEGQSDDTWCVACSVSGTTASCGTAIEYSGSSVQYSDTIKIDTDKFVLVHEEFSLIRTSIGTLSGTTLTDEGDSGFGSYNSLPASWSDAASQISLAEAGTDQFILISGGDDVSAENNDDFLSIYAVTVSGTTQTIGASTTIVSNVTENPSGVLVPNTADDDTHFVVAYNNPSGGAGTMGYTEYASVNWSTRVVTGTTPDNFEGDIGGDSDCALDTALVGEGKIIICYQDDGDGDKGKCIIGNADYTGAASDSCTYDTGDWEVKYSDNCMINTDPNVDGTIYLQYDGAGSFKSTVPLTCDKIIADPGFTIEFGAGAGFQRR